jgi:limonene-1,2-epoxide hydrolase
MVVLAVALAGAVGCVLTVTDVGADTQVVLFERLTRIGCDPAATLVNVVDVCHVPPSILYS